MPFATHRGIRLYYEIAGNGSPLLLIMGLGGSVRAWGHQWPAFTAAHQVLAADNRGAGRSDAPDGRYTVDEMAGDMLAVMDDAGMDSAHVLGFSLGGLVAQALYHGAPDRIRSLVLCATGVGPNDPATVRAEPAIRETVALAPDALPARERLERLTEAFYHPDYRARVPDLVDRLLAFQRQEPVSPVGYRGQLHAACHHAPNSPRLGAIRAPCLVIHGVDDRVWPPANARRLARGIAGARLCLVPGAGHMLPLEQPSRFNREVLDFLEAVDRQTRAPLAAERQA